jgi:hypothetical protein
MRKIFCKMFENHSNQPYVWSVNLLMRTTTGTGPVWGDVYTHALSLGIFLSPMPCDAYSWTTGYEAAY